MNRRSFFKSLAGLAAVAAIDPSALVTQAIRCSKPQTVYCDIEQYCDYLTYSAMIDDFDLSAAIDESSGVLGQAAAVHIDREIVLESHAT